MTAKAEIIAISKPGKYFISAILKLASNFSDISSNFSEFFKKFSYNFLSHFSYTHLLYSIYMDVFTGVLTHCTSAFLLAMLV